MLAALCGLNRRKEGEEEEEAKKKRGEKQAMRQKKWCWKRVGRANSEPRYRDPLLYRVESSSFSIRFIQAC